MARPPKNMSASVRAKLLNLAASRGEDFNLILVRFAVERFLFRLSNSKHADSFILKGAMLFSVWGGHRHRATRDLDLLGFGEATVERLIATFTDVCRVEVPDDGIRFDAETVRAEEIRATDEYGGIRVTLRAEIGSAVIPVQIDVGFGDVLTPPALTVTYPTLLEMPNPQLRAYPKETVIAEKTEAIAKLGMLNSRFKDYYDIRELARTQEFDGALLTRAIQATFNRRGTALSDAAPVGLTPEFAADSIKQQQWRAFVNKGTIVETELSLSQVVEEASGFIAPVLSAAAKNAPFALRWQPGGPWK